MKRVLILMVAVLLSPVLGAKTSMQAVRQSVELSTLATGTIEISSSGSVTRYTLDQPDKLMPAVKKIAADSIPGWKFEPVLEHGVPIAARAKMNLRFVARKLENNDYQIALKSAYFGDQRADRSESAGSKRMLPPKYPVDALRAGIEGTVYLALKLDRQGNVIDAIAEQTNLNVLGTERQMQQGRKLLADASLAAARGWKLDPPVAGEHASDPFRSVRVPVAYRIGSDPHQERYGQWTAYVPGPRQDIPWAHDYDDARESPDTLLAGIVYQMGTGLKLLTPLPPG